MDKKIRIDEWCKEHGLYEDYRKAYLRPGNFAKDLAKEEMEESMKRVLNIFAEQNVPLHDQLVSSFVFPLTPQGSKFWWKVYAKAAMPQNVKDMFREKG